MKLTWISLTLLLTTPEFLLALSVNSLPVSIFHIFCILLSSGPIPWRVVYIVHPYSTAGQTSVPKTALQMLTCWFSHMSNIIGLYLMHIGQFHYHRTLSQPSYIFNDVFLVKNINSISKSTIITWLSWTLTK